MEARHWASAGVLSSAGTLPKSLEREPSPHVFSELRILKGLRGLLFVTAHSKGLTRGQLRPKPGKTRCLLGTAHSKGLKPANSRQLAVNTSRRMKSLRARRVSRWRFPVGKGRGEGVASVANTRLTGARFGICGNDWSYGRFFGSVANTGVSDILEEGRGRGRKGEKCRAAGAHGASRDRLLTEPCPSRRSHCTIFLLFVKR